jgi:hypothetical protein
MHGIQRVVRLVSKTAGAIQCACYGFEVELTLRSPHRIFKTFSDEKVTKVHCVNVKTFRPG